MPSPSSPPIAPVPSAAPGLSPTQCPTTVRYKILNPAYKRHARILKLRNIAMAVAYLLPLWIFLVRLLRPEPFWEALLIGLERSGPLAGGALFCFAWLSLRSEDTPSAWKTEERTLSFDHTGLTFLSDLQQTHTQWRAFQSWEENAHGFTLHEYTPVFIPSYPFPPETLAAFRNCLRANLPEKNQRTDNPVDR